MPGSAKTASSPGSSSDTGEDRRYRPRDRLWLGVSNIQMVSSAEPLSLDIVRDRVEQLATQEPGLRYFRGPGNAPDRHRRLTGSPAEFAEALVRPLAGPDVETAAAAVLQEDDGRPRPAIFVGHGLVGHRFPHVFGDGLSAATHLRRLAAGPEPESTKNPWPIPGTPTPIRAALENRYLKHGYRKAPGLLLADLKAPRPAPPAGPGPGAGAPTQVEIVLRVMAAPAVAELKAWRKEHGNGASNMAVMVGALRRGLAENGQIPAADGMYVAFDARGYLPRVNTGGNFISVTYLAPDEPTDPSSVHTAVQATMSSGRPLLALTAGSVREALKRHTPLPELPGTDGRRTVAFSHMRVGGILPQSLIADPTTGVATILAASKPTSAGSLSFLLAETGDQVAITAVFCSPYFDRADVATVIDEFVVAPAKLLG